MLRLACTVFAWWLGAVFVIVAVRLAARGRRSDWLPVAVVASALVALLVWNAIDPEVVVVHTNVDRAVAGERFDPTYLASLSDDAVPALVAALPRLDDADRQAVMDVICADPSPGPRGLGRAQPVSRCRQRGPAPRSADAGLRDSAARADLKTRKRPRPARGPRPTAPGPRGSCSPSARGAAWSRSAISVAEPIIVIGEASSSSGDVSNSGAAASA